LNYEFRSNPLLSSPPSTKPETVGGKFQTKCVERKTSGTYNEIIKIKVETRNYFNKRGVSEKPNE
jgi:hypothetical protein